MLGRLGASLMGAKWAASGLTVLNKAVWKLRKCAVSVGRARSNLPR